MNPSESFVDQGERHRLFRASSLAMALPVVFFYLWVWLSLWYFSPLFLKNITQLCYLKYHINTIQQRIFDQAYQIMNCSINKCEKINFFCHTKRIRKRPTFIDICKLKTDRSVFSKFKLSAHSPAIERGRYTNIERSKRICLSCNRQRIEDEYHFFSICLCYTSLRDTYIQNINKNLNFNLIIDI